MFAEWKQPIVNEGLFKYRYLLYEAGVIGEQLYLEAESESISANGMGCFWDDASLALFGIMNGEKDSEIQCLYHVTLGKK